MKTGSHEKAYRPYNPLLIWTSGWESECPSGVQFGSLLLPSPHTHLALEPGLSLGPFLHQETSW